MLYFFWGRCNRFDNDVEKFEDNFHENSNLIRGGCKTVKVKLRLIESAEIATVVTRIKEPRFFLGSLKRFLIKWLLF